MGKLKHFIPVFFTLCVVFLFYIKRFVVLKFYPPICNFFIFSLFFFSLFTKETIIQKFARMMEGNLKPPVLNYTRKITYLWAIFTFLNFLVSVWTIFLPDNIWILYNGCISYILVGLLFLIEYSIRIFLRKRKLI